MTSHRSPADDRDVGGWFAPGIASRLTAPLVLGLLPVLFAGCTGQTTEGPSASDGFTSVETEEATPALEVIYTTDTIHCTGEQVVVAEIRGAEPGEVLAFDSALPVDLPNAVADRDGNHTVRWSCAPEEARLRWTLTATGLSSGRTATVSFSGTDVAPDGDGIVFTPTETPFVCDGLMKMIGTLSGGVPDEPIDVVSSRTGRVTHRPDGLGEVPLWWICTPDEAATWEVRVEAEGQGRSMTFRVVGVPADLSRLPELSVVIDENPFVCDGDARYFATISGLYAFEGVDFTTPVGVDLLGGSADGEGNLPIRWQCSPGDAGQNVVLTAIGSQSTRSIDIAFSTAAPPIGTVGPLAVTMTEEPFVCDGGTRVFATIRGFSANEVVRFVSTTAEDLREGQADRNGDLPIRWQCEPADVGTVWEITGTGRTSGRSVTITITGAAQG